MLQKFSSLRLELEAKNWTLVNETGRVRYFLHPKGETLSVFMHPIILDGEEYAEQTLPGRRELPLPKERSR